MKTYKFSDIQLTQQERFEFDCLSREYQIKKLALDTYILAFICPRIGVDREKGVVQYDIAKGEFTFIEHAPVDVKPEMKDSAPEQPKGGDSNG